MISASKLSVNCCEICGFNKMEIAYQGKIRDGSFGSFLESSVVKKCFNCGVERLDEKSCRSEDIYKSEEYRTILNQRADSEGYFAEHDKLQIRNLNALWPYSLRGKIIADIGCAAGSFLDHVRGLAERSIAIEPCQEYHDSLAKRGYEVYPYVGDALAKRDRSVDVAFCFSVIEHVANPRVFLEEIAQLLKHNGNLIISTPNRRDLLMDLLPDIYPSFFYRTVHRWYFDLQSLKFCVEQAGFEIREFKCIHRFGLSNAFAWLRDHKPVGDAPVPHINAMLDGIWKLYLEEKQIGDYLYLIVQKCN